MMFQLKCLKARIEYFFIEKLPWKLAYLMPRKITLFCFVRVYATLGECGKDYKDAYNNWAKGLGR